MKKVTCGFYYNHMHYIEKKMDKKNELNYWFALKLKMTDALIDDSNL